MINVIISDHINNMPVEEFLLLAKELKKKLHKIKGSAAQKAHTRLGFTLLCARKVLAYTDLFKTSTVSSLLYEVEKRLLTAPVVVKSDRDNYHTLKHGLRMVTLLLSEGKAKPGGPRLLTVRKTIQTIAAKTVPKPVAAEQQQPKLPLATKQTPTEYEVQYPVCSEDGNCTEGKDWVLLQWDEFTHIAVSRTDLGLLKLLLDTNRAATVFEHSGRPRWLYASVPNLTGAGKRLRLEAVLLGTLWQARTLSHKNGDPLDFRGSLLTIHEDQARALTRRQAGTRLLLECYLRNSVTEAGVPPAQEKEWFALIEAASAERDAAQDELAVAKMRSTTLQKSLNLQTLELEGTNGRLTAIKDLGIELQNSLAAKEQKHTKLQDDFSKLQKHNANQNTQIATMQAQLANASGAPGYESTQEIEELKLSLGEANSYCDNRDVEVERLQAANKKLMSDIRQLRALLDAQAKESPAEAVVEVHNVINKILTAGFSPEYTLRFIKEALA